jgi:hypothetical protein
MSERIEPTTRRGDDAVADTDADRAIVAPPPDEPDRAPTAGPRGGRREGREAAEARRRARVRAWVRDRLGSGEAPRPDALVGLAARALRLRATPWLRAVVDATVAEWPAAAAVAAPRLTPDQASDQPADPMPGLGGRRRSGRRGRGGAPPRAPTPVRRDPALPEDSALLPLDPPAGAGSDESLEARAVRTLRARLTAGQAVWVAPAGGAGTARRYRLFAASPRGYTNVSLVAAHALGLSRHLALGRTAIATDRPPADLVAALARRVGLDGALVCRWT